MRFKEFIELEEGLFSDLFGKPKNLGPKMLKYGDAKKPATSYGSNARSAAIARKWNQMQAETEAQKQEKRRNLR